MSTAKPRRRGRGLLIVLVILLLIAVVGDRVAESVAEKRLATEAVNEAAQYDVTAASTTAEIGGFGFLPQLARGEFSEITVTMDRPSVSKVSAEDLTMVMTGVQVPREMLTGDTSATVVIGQADIRLRMSPDALTRLTAGASGIDGLKLTAAGEKLQATVRGVDAVATVRPEVRNGRIGLIVDNLPDGVPARVRTMLTALLARGIRIPELPFGATVTQAAVQGQSLVVTATANDVRLSGA
ncbi:hypothetical protein BWI15_15815 [Kribbella sp. ALI-6-A]|uniref:LmeA family phospholipid-binding protein n=1 Tax=Kribbella sp. ALI-6-A TaxID=1933817 RepID=UPI00097C58F0|nr:DUF2993 domain-containing protein [Kribbella sp. ALI-6-A]ONI71627.1 hypothetical protein BWI15_15815 [Kribbella sp. ALI-6-A]